MLSTYCFRDSPLARRIETTLYNLESMMKTRAERDMPSMNEISQLMMAQIDKSRGPTIQRIAISEFERDWKAKQACKASFSDASESTVEPEMISNPEAESSNDGTSDKEGARQVRETLKEQHGAGFRKGKAIKNLKHNPRGVLNAIDDMQSLANSSPEAFAAAYGSAADSGIWKFAPKPRSSGDRRKRNKAEFREVMPVGLVCRDAMPKQFDIQNPVGENAFYDTLGFDALDANVQPCAEAMPMPKWFTPNPGNSYNLQSDLAPWQPRDSGRLDCFAELRAAAIQQGLISQTCCNNIPKDRQQPVSGGRWSVTELSL